MSTGHPIINIDLVLGRHSTREVLSAVLHSILFHRLLGIVKPMIIDVLDVSVPGVDDADIIQDVNEKVDAFWKGVEGGDNKRGQIFVTLSEKRPRKTWFLMLEEEVPWEQWIINAEVRQPTTEKERQEFNSNILSSLTKTLQVILNHTASEQGRNAVPKITTSQGISPFPIKVSVKVGGVEVG